MTTFCCRSGSALRRCCAIASAVLLLGITACSPSSMSTSTSAPLDVPASPPLTTVGSTDADPTSVADTATTDPDVVEPGEPWILFQGATTFLRVFLVRPDGTGRHPPMLDVPGMDQTNPDWSPDGQRVTFVVREVGTFTDDLWVADVDGTHAERLVDCQDPCRFVDDPAWSPDGHSIAFSRTVEAPGDSSENTLERYDLDTGTTSVLLAGGAMDGYAGARWSPDGRSIVVEVVHKVRPEVSDELTGETLSVVDLSTVPPTVRPLTDPALFAATADWSPRGDLIVYAALATPGAAASDLFTIRPDGSGLARVTRFAEDGGSASEPTFTVDGDGLVFVGRRADIGDGVLAAIDLDGTDLHPATSDGYQPGNHPRFRPIP